MPPYLSAALIVLALPKLSHNQVAWKGWRPTLPGHIPRVLQLLCALCWHADPRMRPSFTVLHARLAEAQVGGWGGCVYMWWGW